MACVLGVGPAGWAAPELTVPTDTAEQASPLERARRLRLEGMVLERKGRYDLAVLSLDEACQLFESEQGPHAIELARCLHVLGRVHSIWSGKEKSEPRLLRALAIMEGQLGPDHIEVSAVLSDLAMHRLRHGPAAETGPLLERALRIRESAPGPEYALVADTLSDIATLQSRKGLLAEAEATCQRALTLLERSPDSDFGMQTGGECNAALAEIRWRQGALREAMSFYERGLQLSERALGADSLVYARQLSHVAYRLLDVARYDDAIALSRQAAAIQEAAHGPQSEDLSVSLSNLALAFKGRGDLDESRRLNERVLLMRKEILDPRNPHIGISMNNLARVYAALGDWERAHVMQERSLAHLTDFLGPSHIEVVNAVVGLASIDVHLGRYEQVTRLLEGKLSQLQGADIKSVRLRGRLLHTLGDVHRASGDLESALAYFRQAVEERERGLGPRHPDVAGSLGGVVRCLAGLGEHREALASILRARAIVASAQGTTHPFYADALHLESVLIETQGDHAAALAARQQYEALIEHNLARTLLVAEESQRLAYARQLVAGSDATVSLHLQAAPEHEPTAELALTTILRRKARSQELIAQTYGMLRRSLPAEHQHLLDDLGLLHAQISALTRRRSASEDDVSRELSVLEEERDRVWALLDRHSEQLTSATTPPTIADVRAALPGDAALVEFVRYGAVFDGPRLFLDRAPQRYAAYIVRPGDSDWVDLGAAEDIDALVDSLRLAIVERGNAIAPGRALYDAVMRPVVDRVGLTRSLFIAPDSELNLVPFDALVDEYGQFVIERFSIHYLSTGRDLLRPWLHRASSRSGVAVVANPTGAALPGTEREAEILTELFEDVVLLRRDDAHEAAVRSLSPPRILHLATHGFFGTVREGTGARAGTRTSRSPVLTSSELASVPPDNPMLHSGLTLAHVTDHDDARGDHDGILTAFEVSGWDLRGTELVTLSACDTGRGEVERGEGVLGLRRAFAMAGTQTQVMSLWKVPDMATATLMGAFYRELRAGRGRSDAMRMAQLDLMRASDTRHPRDWAGFVVVGEWGPLSGTVSEGPPSLPPARGCRARIGAVDASSGEEASWAWLCLVALLLHVRRANR